MLWTRRVAIAGIAWCAGLLAATALPGGPPLPTPAVLVSTLLLAVPVFAIVVIAVAVRVGSAASAFYRLLRQTIPGWLLLASWLLFAGFWLVGMLSVGGMPGEPEQRDGAYVANNDGDVTFISRAQYLTMTAQEQRFVLSVPAGFCVWGAVVSTALLRREAQQREAAQPI